MKQDIPMAQIDEMDIGFYFELLNYDSEKEKNEEVHFIDQVLF